MAKIPLSTAEIATLRPLTPDEVAAKDKALDRPELVEALRELSKDLPQGADPFQRRRDDEARANAPASDVQAYIAPTAPPIGHDPTHEVRRVKLAPGVDPRARPTVASIRRVAPETKRSRGGTSAAVLVVAALLAGGAWLARAALATTPAPVPSSAVHSGPEPESQASAPVTSTAAAPIEASSAARVGAEPAETAPTTSASSAPRPSAPHPPEHAPVF